VRSLHRFKLSEFSKKILKETHSFLETIRERSPRLAATTAFRPAPRHVSLG
jgi:hypothetical protein